MRAERGGYIADHEPVTITFALAFQKVAEASAAAADVLRVCAFLAPDAITEEVFAVGAAEMGESLRPVAGGGINLVKIMGEAGRFSLIRRDAKGGRIEMHRLVQQVLRDEMSAEERRLWADRAVRGVGAAFPEVEHKSWPLCEKFLPHAQEAARLIEGHDLAFAESAQLLNEAGRYCFERARYEEAVALFKRSLTIRERVLGSEHAGVATSLNNLAALYDNQGRYAEAEPLLERSLALRERVLGPDHPDVAGSLSSLAALYESQGRYAGAKPLLERSLAICEKTLEPNHPKIAPIRKRYAELLKRSEDKAEK